MKYNVFFAIIGAIISPLFVIFAWAFWLERRKPYPEQTRRLLLLVVLLLTLAESWCVWIGALRRWMPLPILLVNGWGYVDAVLRFPIVHELESFFVVKNLLLLAFKVVTLAFGFRQINKANNVCCLVFFMVTNLLGIPALYLLALPLDDTHIEQRMAAHDVNDVDLAESLFRCITNSQYRKEVLSNTKKRLRFSTQHLLQLPLVTKVVECTSPRHRKPLTLSQRKAV